MTQYVILGPAAIAQQQLSRLPDPGDQRVGVVVRAGQVIALRAPCRPHALLERRAGVDLRPAEAKGLRKVLAHEVQVIEHRCGRGLGMEDDDRVLGRNPELLAQIERSMLLGHALASANRCKASGRAGFDAEKDSQQPHRP